METFTPTQGHPIDPADRINALIEEISRVLTRHARANFIGDALLLLIWNRIMRLARRFAGLAARARAGTLSRTVPALSQEAAAPPQAEPEPPPAAVSGPPRAAPPEVLPRHFAWLVRMLPEASRFGPTLVWLLQRLEMEELIFAAPQVGRVLRPLCHMLGVEPTAALRLPAWVPGAVASTTDAAAPQPVEGIPAADATLPPDDGLIWGLPPYGFPLLPLEPEPDAEVVDFDQRKRA